MKLPPTAHSCSKIRVKTAHILGCGWWAKRDIQRRTHNKKNITLFTTCPHAEKSAMLI
jgi:hypothetical protein